jgi:hypothetical protein
LRVLVVYQIASTVRQYCTSGLDRRKDSRRYLGFGVSESWSYYTMLRCRGRGGSIIGTAGGDILESISNCSGRNHISGESSWWEGEQRMEWKDFHRFSVNRVTDHHSHLARPSCICVDNLPWDCSERGLTVVAQIGTKSSTRQPNN